MMTMDSNKEIYDILNNAIKDMKDEPRSRRSR